MPNALPAIETEVGLLPSGKGGGRDWGTSYRGSGHVVMLPPVPGAQKSSPAKRPGNKKRPNYGGVRSYLIKASFDITGSLATKTLEGGSSAGTLESKGPEIEEDDYQEQVRAALAIQKNTRAREARREVEERRKDLEEQKRASLVIQKKARARNARMEVEGRRKEAQEQNVAATKLQAMQRGKKARVKVQFAEVDAAGEVATAEMPTFINDGAFVPPPITPQVSFKAGGRYSVEGADDDAYLSGGAGGFDVSKLSGEKVDGHVLKRHSNPEERLAKQFAEELEGQEEEEEEDSRICVVETAVDFKARYLLLAAHEEPGSPLTPIPLKLSPAPQRAPKFETSLNKVDSGVDIRNSSEDAELAKGGEKYITVEDTSIDFFSRYLVDGVSRTAPGAESFSVKKQKAAPSNAEARPSSQPSSQPSSEPAAASDKVTVVLSSLNFESRYLVNGTPRDNAPEEVSTEAAAAVDEPQPLARVPAPDEKSTEAEGVTVAIDLNSANFESRYGLSSQDPSEHPSTKNDLATTPQEYDPGTVTVDSSSGDFTRRYLVCGVARPRVGAKEEAPAAQQPATEAATPATQTPATEAAALDAAAWDEAEVAKPKQKSKKRHKKATGGSSGGAGGRKEVKETAASSGAPLAASAPGSAPGVALRPAAAHDASETVLGVVAAKGPGEEGAGKVGGAVEPLEPMEPMEPMEPVEPIEPIEPIEPVEPAGLDESAPIEVHEDMFKTQYAGTRPSTRSVAVEPAADTSEMGVTSSPSKKEAEEEKRKIQLELEKKKESTRRLRQLTEEQDETLEVLRETFRAKQELDAVAEQEAALCSKAQEQADAINALMAEIRSRRTA